MSSFVIHLLIPPLIALSVRFLPARYVWAWVWVSVVPDVDYVAWILYANDVVSVNLHRAVLHTGLITAVLAAGAALSFRGYRVLHPGGLREVFVAYAGTARGAGWLLATYYHFTHVVLDTAAGGVSALWPFTLRSLYWYFRIDVDTQTQQLRPEVGGGTAATAPDVSPVYTWLTSEQVAFVFLMLLGIAFQHWSRSRAERVRLVEAQRARLPP